MEFEVGQYVWLNIQDFLMPNKLTPHFTTKYKEPNEILHKLHLNVYNLKLPINFVAHSPFTTWN